MSRTRLPRLARRASAPLRRLRWREAVLLLDGEISDLAAARRLCGRGAALLCADGGARHAARMGLEPAVILGDMDSLPKRLPAWRRAVFVCDFGQDSSDLEKALNFAAHRGVRQLWVAGALGGRLDHELVNLALLEAYSDRLSIALLGPETAAILRPGTHRLPAKAGDRVTLLAATAQARVSTRGLRYPLRGELLARSSRGLSNRAESAGPRITVSEGRLWAIWAAR